MRILVVEDEDELREELYLEKPFSFAEQIHRISGDT
jgi:DNA-binding response OmpR family regulator